VNPVLRVRVLVLRRGIVAFVIPEALAVAAHRLGADRDGVLARLGGALGEDARAKAAALVGDSRLRRAEWAARARVPVPAGLRGVHATWIEAALAALPARARIVLAGGPGDAPDGVKTFDSSPRTAPGMPPSTITDGARIRGLDVWLARLATASFVPLPPEQPGPPRTPADIAALAPEDALRWLANVGLDQLAVALAGPWIAQAAATLGAEFAAAQARIQLPPRAGAMGPQRAALERCLDQVPFAGDARVIVGARTVAPFVPVLARRALVLRLPKPLGERLYAELVAFARGDVSRGPSWRALAA
jgi:hypothetical protein